jgi:YD repeat-containing protein
MGFSRVAASGRRVRWLVVFTLFFLASAVVPVLASSESEQSAEVFATEGERGLPDGEDIAAALAKSEAEEEARAKELEGPNAAREREESRLAFEDLTAAEAEDILDTLFGEWLDAREDPARRLSDARILKTYGSDGALIEEEGERKLIDGTVPLRTRDEDGELSKIDLTLRPTPDGFEPANPLTALEIPTTSGEPVELGNDGLAIDAVGGEEDRGARLLEDQDVFYPEVHQDSDRLVSPTSRGVEFFDVLRSAKSPETLRYRLDLPEGAVLRQSGEAATILTDGEPTMRVRPPFGLDAQGTEVPVSMEVQGDSLELSVPHREGDFAYPLLIDPEFDNLLQEDWLSGTWFHGYHFNDLYQWDWHTNSSWIYGQTYTIYHDFGGSGRGLHVSSRSGDFGPDKWGHWAYTLPTLGSYVEAIEVFPWWYENHGCQKYYYSLPKDYVGLWDEVGQQYNPIRHNRAYWDGYAKLGFSGENPGWGHTATIGLYMGANGADMPCWRDFYAGGARLYLNDWQDPEVDGFSGVPSGWIGPDTPVTVTANTTDAGLGVREVAFNPEDTATLYDQVGCSGLAGDRCPNSYGAQRTFTGKSLDEGKKWLRATATDALAKGSYAETAYTKVDRSEPKLTLSGQLAQVTGEVGSSEKPAGEGDELTLPIYRLNISATDGSDSAPEDERSGVSDVRVYLDGKEQEVPWGPNEDPCDNCPMDVTYELQLHDVSPGKHVLEVDAEDHVGMKRERDIEFEYFPATGMKDEYVMHHFPLPDGQGDEEEEEHPARPELAVNVATGNLVYRERDIDVEGPAVDLEVERYYNSMLPAEEDTGWGEGWTLAQTPELEPEEGGTPSEADLLDASGGVEEDIELPTETGEEKFDPELQATIEKDEGGYELRDETGESATSVGFDESGRTEELRTDGAAKVELGYEGGELSEIAVQDPASAGSPTEEPEEGEGSGSSGETPTFSSAFGELGSGDGQLNRPADLAMDASGRLWVVDKSNNRVQEFDAEGNFVSKFGSYGTGNGQFNRPASIAIDAAGDFWVTDANNDRVQKFDDEGNFLAKFGTGGSGNGQLNGPEGIAIDAEGNLWVSDTYNGRVQKFNAQGEFLQVIGSKGSGEGQIGEATGIDTDSAGNVWIADWQNNRVSVFDSQGEFLDSFGSQGTGDGQFNRPDAIDVDAEGNVWVGDQNNDRIQRFDLAGQYVDQFGSTGSGEGQFDFAYPMGLFADDNGHVWVSDTLNHRVQRWSIPDQATPHLEHLGGFGEAGSEAGQLEAPSDVAIGPEGDLWVADTENDRIQRFDAQGELLSQFGSAGSEDGQLNQPTGVEIDGEGNLWVVDRGNHRLQRFSPEGQFLSKFGEFGFGEGKLAAPGQVAIDAAGDLWITDYFRLQRFSPNGEFVGVVGAGQLSQPTGIDIGPEGAVWVASSGNDKVFAFDDEGELVTQLGSSGAGEGQFEQPIDIALGPQGNLWVADAQLDRVQLLDQDGDYIAQFGETGAGEEQLNLANPSGIAVDAGGNLWIADRGNDRIQQWLGFTFALSGEEATPEEDDPKVEIETAEGLVSSVSGEEAGEHDYEHDDGLLTSVDGPDGETAYEYDEEGRLTKVTLPNETWGEVAYDPDDGRVSKVTVDPAGEEPATSAQFYFTDGPPRETKVVPSNAPYVVYEIGEDGSVLKWWNTEKPPTILLAGTLTDGMNSSTPLTVSDHTLEVQAFSAEGIDSIEVIAEGDILVDEKVCEPESEETEIEECEDLINEWVTHTDLHSPGRLDLEVVVTDRTGKNTASERFWVTIPKPPPPPPPGAQLPPRFHDILEFREEYGLEVVFPVDNELELHDRIFNLIGAWNNPHSPEGKVARASMARWGVPLRAEDVAELEYREWLYDVNAEKIDQWVEATNPGSYAGYYLDHGAGGIMHIGFLGDQEEQLENLESSLSLVGGSRLSVYPNPPTTPYVSVRATTQSVMGAIETNSTLANLVISVEDDEAGRATRVGTPNVAQVEGILDQMLGANAPVIVEYDAGGGGLLSGRFRNEGRMRAGDAIFSKKYTAGTPSVHKGNGMCTAGFGAKDKVGQRRGRTFWRLFVLTAGHCNRLNSVYEKTVYRSTDSNPSIEDNWKKVGEVTRDALHQAGSVTTDAEAIRVQSSGLVPQGIFGWDGQLIPTRPAGRVRKGNVVCFSGARTQVPKCGQVVARSTRWTPTANGDGFARGGYWVKFDRPAIPGDSGAPVWAGGSKASIGLVTAGRPEGSLTETLVEPLLHPPNLASNQVVGILHNPHMAPLSLKLGR